MCGYRQQKLFKWSQLELNPRPPGLESTVSAFVPPSLSTEIKLASWKTKEKENFIAKLFGKRVSSVGWKSFFNPISESTPVSESSVPLNISYFDYFPPSSVSALNQKMQRRIIFLVYIFPRVMSRNWIHLKSFHRTPFSVTFSLPFSLALSFSFHTHTLSLSQIPLLSLALLLIFFFFPFLSLLKSLYLSFKFTLFFFSPALSYFSWVSFSSISSLSVSLSVLHSHFPHRISFFLSHIFFSHEAQMFKKVFFGVCNISLQNCFVTLDFLHF